ncbi:MAG: ATP-binding protein [Paracoccus sp. (in: a-proteobacteria)]|uniref:YncE family protein n=1 Tax=Paracoccus sp. TaxID=267 RepID=UPI0039E687BD
MITNPRHRTRTLLGTSLLALGLAAGPVLADSIFTPTSDVFAGSISADASERGASIYPGTEVTISGEDLIPGQRITLMRGNTVLSADGPLTVDAEGKISFNLTVDSAAATGVQPIVAIAENPAAATVVEMKVSPQIPLSGEEKFTIESKPVTRGLYQVAYSPKSDALFVTAAVGRPPVAESSVSKLDPKTLEVVASITPPAAPAGADGSDGGVFAVYGVDVDDVNGNVWVSVTRQNSAAVYKQDDLSLVKQFDAGSVAHPRDVVVDEARGRAYFSTSFEPYVAVFDTATLEPLDPIQIASTIRRETFGVRSVQVDEAAGKLFAVSISTPEVAVVDLNSGAVRVLALKNLLAGSDAAYDRQEGLIFVVGQDSDNLLIVKEETGEILHDIEVGANPLSVSFDSDSRLAYVAVRGSDTLTVVDPEGKIVANLDGGSLPNQVRVLESGIYATNKSRGENDARGDRIARISPAQ